MAVFYSFHYKRDSARVQQIVNMGVVEGQPLLNSQEWEKVENQGDAAIKKWIDDQMSYKRAVVVLVGSETASRKWVKYEIIKAWNEKRPLVGIRINKLAPLSLSQEQNGADPFAAVKLETGGSLADYVTLHTPSGSTSAEVYGSIKTNLADQPPAASPVRAENRSGVRVLGLANRSDRADAGDVGDSSDAGRSMVQAVMFART